jgi:hypothetical protein
MAMEGIGKGTHRDLFGVTIPKFIGMTEENYEPPQL